jgi:hypothetical protein
VIDCVWAVGNNKCTEEDKLEKKRFIERDE